MIRYAFVRNTDKVQHDISPFEWKIIAHRPHKLDDFARALWTGFSPYGAACLVNDKHRSIELSYVREAATDLGYTKPSDILDLKDD